jgi:hypothetical protein
MATQVQFRRGTTTQNNAFTGAIGELSYDTEVKTLRLHDGTTAGGGSIVTINAGVQTLTNKTLSTGSAWQGNAVALAYGGTGSSLTAVAGAVPYCGASGLGLTDAGTSGQLLSSGGSSAPTWISASSLTVGTALNATTATNIAGGSAGQIMIQQDTGLTTFISAGASGTFLQSAGAGYAPTWAAGQVTFGTTTVSLGGTSLSLAGLTTLSTTGDVTVGGNLIVNGTTTTINSTTITVDDKNIELGSVATPTNTTANGGGITLKGATDKTITYASSDESWNMNINLNVSGTIAATGDITSPNFYSVSDERFKTNIQDSQYGLAEVMKLRSVQYDMDGRHEVGLLAQNVEEHMSEFVTTDANGVKKLDYAKMVSVLVKTVQDQQAQIEELKAKIGN